MTRKRIEKLLGGYATGTLTGEQLDALYRAALEDQALFEELVREQPLRDLLADRAARSELLAALEDVRLPWFRTWWRPALAAATLAAVVVVAVATLRWSEPAPRPTMMAIVQAPAPVPVPADTGRTAPRREAKVEARAAAPAAAPMAAIPQVAGTLAGVPSAVAPAPNAERPKKAAASLGAGSSSVAESAGLQAAGAANAANAPAAELSARAVAGLAAGRMFATAPADHAGLKYTVLRQTPEGGFAEADPGQLRAGDTIRLRFEVDGAGYLRVVETAAGGAPNEVAAARVEPGRAFETPAWKSGQAGVKEFSVIFSRQTNVGAAADSAAPPVTFVIRLDFR